jgi:Amt family ammonium transporter
VVIGTGLLWFGWFGFNAGSSLAADGLAITAFVNTNFASATAMLTWVMLDGVTGRKRSVVGACVGAVVGLVAITPAAGFVNVGQSVFIGFVAPIISYFAVQYKTKTGIDDTLDVFPCHGVGGIVGMILTAVFAKDVGLVYGHTNTFYFHLLALFIVSMFTFGGSYLLFMLTDYILPMRVSPTQESEGLDLTQHGETATDWKERINGEHA